MINSLYYILYYKLIINKTLSLAREGGRGKSRDKEWYAGVQNKSNKYNI